MNTTLLVLNYCTTLWNNFFEIVDYQIRDVEIKFKYDLLEMLRLHFRYVTLDEKTTSLFNCPPIDCRLSFDFNLYLSSTLRSRSLHSKADSGERAPFLPSFPPRSKGDGRAKVGRVDTVVLLRAIREY